MKHDVLSQKSKYLHLFVCLILLSHDSSGDEVLETTLLYCRYGANYTDGSQFETNLKHLLSSLASSDPLNNNTFYNASLGKDPDSVYGFFQCMSGATADDCRVCLEKSRVQILQNCPNKKQASVRYYNCILRYSDWDFFSRSYLEINERGGGYNVQKVSDPVRFDGLVRTLMESVAFTTSSSPSQMGTGMANKTEFPSLYGLAQCTGDLSNESCNSCLEAAIGAIKSCCYGRAGGMCIW
ncbi:hypothetical protein AAC387_Pa06g2246 [Persea americana]